MTGPRAARSSLTHSLGRALVLLGVTTFALGCVELALVLPDSGAVWVDALTTVVCWVYVAAGALAWWRRPSNQLGALIVAGGLTLLVGGLVATTVPVLVAVGLVLATSPLAVVFHLLHAFPSGRLRGRVSRATVVAGYLVSLVLQAPLYLFAAPGDVPAMLAMADRPALLEAGVWVQGGAGSVVTGVTAAVLLGRLRGAAPRQRRVLTPLYAYGIGTVVFIPTSAIVLAPVLGWTPTQLGTAQLLVLLGVPLAFTAGVLRGGFARTGELDELGTWLGGAGTRRPALAAALAHTLGDPSLHVVFESDQAGAPDPDDEPNVLPAHVPGRASIAIDLDGRRVAIIAYDSALITDSDLVLTAGRVVAIAADRERLTAALLVSQADLRTSRARLVDAADRERHRIAQDLHDGLQVQLVLLALHAQEVANAAGASDDTRTEATALRQGIDAAAGDLRRLVHAVMPSALVERGLSAATEDLVDRMPVPTRLYIGITDEALPTSVQNTAYFVVAEGLANAVKHANATTLNVRLVRVADVLLVEVDDDGIGGARLDAGTGLRGLADRVDVLGGLLDLRSAPGAGTRLRVELPCGS